MRKRGTEDGSFVAIPKCYYCNQEKNELLIHRRMENIKHLHGMVVDMEPCDKCKEYMQQGVIVVSVRDGESQEGDPPNPYRTGGWWVMTVESVKRIFNIDFTNELRRFMFIEDGVAQKVGLKKGGDNAT